MLASGNADLHLKNWSLIYPDGRSATLSPAYDLVATALFPGIDRSLALNLARERSMERVTDETFRRLAERSHFDVERATSVVRDQVEHPRAAWEKIREDPPAELSPESRGMLDQRLEALPLFKQAPRPAGA